MSDCTPKVYALMPVHNRFEKTRRAIDLLRSQEGVDLSIIVIDDGSTDETAEYLSRQRDINVIRGDGNLWWAGCMNAGLEAVLVKAHNDEYVLFVNDDTEFDKEWVKNLVRVSRRNDDAAVGGVLRNIDAPNELLSIGPRFDLWNFRIYDWMDVVSDHEKSCPRPVYAVDALPGRGVIYPVSSIKKAGLMRARLLPHYHADYEFAWRVKSKGTLLLVTAEAPVYSEISFGSEKCRSWPLWKRLFGKGSHQNPLHRIILFMMIGTVSQRITVLLRMPLRMVKRNLMRVAGIVYFIANRVRSSG